MPQLEEISGSRALRVFLPDSDVSRLPSTLSSISVVWLGLLQQNTYKDFPAARDGQLVID